MVDSRRRGSCGIHRARLAAGLLVFGALVGTATAGLLAGEDKGKKALQNVAPVEPPRSSVSPRPEPRPLPPTGPATAPAQPSPALQPGQASPPPDLPPPPSQPVPGTGVSGGSAPGFPPNTGGSSAPGGFPGPGGPGVPSGFSGPGRAGPPAVRFQFTIDPKTPLKDLLPTPPKVKKTAGPVLTDDLTRVPEIEFQTPLSKHNAAEALKQTAHQLAKINHLNAKKTDAFIEALREERPDLHGLPFAMGDACRTKGERSKQFNLAVAAVRAALQQQAPLPPPQPTQPVAPTVPPPPGAGIPGAGVGIPGLRDDPPDGIVGGNTNAATFWDRYLANCVQEDKTLARVDRPQREHVTLARIAALMQILAPEAASMRLGLVKYLSTISHAEATRALAKLTLFSTEDEVRLAAVEALKVRRERDYTDILLTGFRYPLPAVAKRAADALVKLERTDLLEKLVAVLDEADPRLPVSHETDGKTLAVVRELVRVNHHKNCMLCHAPGNTGNVSPESLTAGVPIPGEPLSPPSGGYQNSQPDILVRIDVTYLRQDFSAFQAVADANPWPEMQRFDFLVRSREVSGEEADAYRQKLELREPGRVSPYHRAALTALRELTGKDAAPTAEAWRKLLDLPTKLKRTVSLR